MNRNYNKIKHIQEVNQKLDEEFKNVNREIVNEQLTQAISVGVAGTIGLGRQIGTWISNIFKSGGEKNPLMTGAFVQLKNYSRTLKNQLVSAKKDLPVLWGQNKQNKIQEKIKKLRAMNSSQSNNQAKDLEYQLNTLNYIVSTYNTFLDSAIEVTDSMINSNIQEFSATQGNTTQQTMQQGVTQAATNVAQTTQQKI